MSDEYNGEEISGSEWFQAVLDDLNFLSENDLDVDGFGNCYSDADPGL